MTDQLTSDQIADDLGSGITGDMKALKQFGITIKYSELPGYFAYQIFAKEHQRASRWWVRWFNVRFRSKWYDAIVERKKAAWFMIQHQVLEAVLEKGQSDGL